MDIMNDSTAPCEITQIEIVWIPMPDGTRLAARMWIPTSAQPKAVPAILEYTPYRRRDAAWDTMIRTRSAISCTASDYIVEADLESIESDRRIFSRSWTQRIRRDFT
jgi:predicted acyl esterase